MKYLKTYELKINSHYDYDLIQTSNKHFINDDNESVYATSYIYKFESKVGNIYAEIFHYDEPYDWIFSIHFQDEENYLKNEKMPTNKIKYVNTNKGDSIKILATIFHIVKNFYNENKDILNGFGFTVDENKRKNIYNFYIKQLFPNSKLVKNEFTDDTRRFFYTIN